MAHIICPMSGLRLPVEIIEMPPASKAVPPEGSWRTFGQRGEARLYSGDMRATLPEIAADPLGVVIITDPPNGCQLENHDAGGARADRSFAVAGDEDQTIGIELCQWAERLGLPILAFADIMLPWPGKWRQHLVWDKGPGVGAGGDPGKLWKQSIEIIQVARTGVLSGKRDEACLHFHIHSGSSPHHPCEKPLKLLRYLIEKVSKPDSIIFDPFAGSFSVGVAAAQCGRRFIGCEIAPAHYATGCKRMAKEFDRPLLVD